MIYRSVSPSVAVPILHVGSERGFAIRTLDVDGGELTMVDSDAHRQSTVIDLHAAWSSNDELIFRRKPSEIRQNVLVQQVRLRFERDDSLDEVDKFNSATNQLLNLRAAN